MRAERLCTEMAAYLVPLLLRYWRMLAACQAASCDRMHGLASFGAVLCYFGLVVQTQHWHHCEILFVLPVGRSCNLLWHQNTFGTGGDQQRVHVGTFQQQYCPCSNTPWYKGAPTS